MEWKRLLSKKRSAARSTLKTAPDVFAYIREKLDGIQTQKLKEFLNPNDTDNVKAIKKAGEGMGKSGSFFFFSKCDEFLIKTMTMSDFKKLT